jgi:uncharacterized membrane protein YfcA
MGHALSVWVALGAAALLVGFAKTAIGGLATVAVALFAGVLPARESTAALLLLLLVGDVLAVSIYRRHCDWSLLRLLVPGVLPGLGLGALVLAVLEDRTIKAGIGLILLLLVAVQLVTSRRGQSRSPWTGRAKAATGVGAGVTTMVANAGGPVMTLYLVAQGVDKRRFLGTAAWFFLGVNLCKLPFSVGLGLLHRDTVLTMAPLVPLVLLGGAVGVHVVRRIGQRSFDAAVLAASVVSAVALLLA